MCYLRGVGRVKTAEACRLPRAVYPGGMPATIRDVLRTLTADPGRPRLTWYGDGGERIELSGAVLVNWASKTTNLLVEELDAAPGTVVTLDLPPHWRALVWALATWQCGAELRAADGAPTSAVSPADVVVTSAPGRWLGPDGRRPRHGDLVVVSLPALARRYDGDLPAGAIDAASAVMTYADAVGYTAPTDLAAVALDATAASASDDAPRVRYDALLDWATGSVPGVDAETGDRGTAVGARTLVRTTDGAQGAVALLRASLRAWAQDGSVVVLGSGMARELDADPARLARLVETERVTAP